jgi:hypothetical protein
MTAPLTLDQLAALAARIPALEARIAELESKLDKYQDPDLNQLLDVKVAAAEANARGANTTAEAIYKQVARGHIKRHPVGASKRYRIRLGDVLGGGGE